MVNRRTAAAILVCAVALAALAAPAPPAPILAYIKATWSVLTRSNRDLATAAVDPKLHPAANGRWPVYVSRTEDFARVEEGLRREMPPGDFRKIELRTLPEDAASLKDQGLLYLPLPYVVPGGRFNEMYGWDSYFIQIGLLRDNELTLGKDMADDFLYEIRNYGKILNANRTYYVTRSQPPFLTQMVLNVYRRMPDRQWLAESLPAIERYYRYWTAEPHLTPETGLSRYFDLGEGPAPEVVASERDPQGRTHYELAREYFRTHRISAYDVSQYYERNTGRLLPLFYKGDRSMRESGFDPSDRFGPFSVDIIHYDPVCLNSLLYLMETQADEILGLLGREAEAALWRKRARDRAERINALMWDSHDGLYYDYNFVQKRVRRYPFLTTFYPLWAGIASRGQAARVMRNLKLFERAGGLQTSTYRSGNQWDAPFGWAPLELIAAEGLRRYGYNADANRISEHFLSLVLREFRRQGTIVEKYDVVRGGTDVSREIRFGYRSNEAGFGWTNAVFTALYDALPPGERVKIGLNRAANPSGAGR
ncbi:MAG: alpha,alpha-trehalase [Acidobacteriia bacterium]|nr:alpha,alpha-trehalase [Terriglobia bacterium]